MKKKFTLIELIIVIVVIGLLAAMALPKVTGIVQSARISAMINDKETLEKAILLHYQKYDNLPLLNEDQELIVLNNNISLTKLVKAEEINDMSTIYTSLQETLKYYSDEEEYLYRIDISKIKESLSKGLKYGYKENDKDFYVYSTKTNNVYYYSPLKNKKGILQHNEYETSTKEIRLIDKKLSYDLDRDTSGINSKPVIEFTTDLSNLTNNSMLKWTYNFIDEDKTPTKVSFILNDVEYTNFNNIPTQLEEGKYTLIFKMQDKKGEWSNEIKEEFEVYKEGSFGGMSFPQGTIITSNSGVYQNHIPKYAIDGDLGTHWNSNGRVDTLTLTFPKPIQMSKIQIIPVADPVGLETYTIEGLSNGVWEEIGKESFMVYFDPMFYTPISVKENSYSSIRISINSSSPWVAIYEINRY